MRFVAKYGASCIHEKPDSELSGAELRFKYCTTKQEIEEAKRRLQRAYANGEDEKDQTGKDSIGNGSKMASIGCDSSSSSSSSSSRRSRRRKLEKALLDGLQGFVSQEERNYIMDLMTSGDPNKLAQAAHILFEIRQLNNVHHGNDPGSGESVLINSIRSLVSQHKTSEAEIKVMKRISMATSLEEKLPPMPKHVVLKADFDVNARYSKLIKFKDDGWDGSLSDAFSRMYSNKSDQDDEHGGRKEHENRVVVTEARRQAAKAGIEKGDVVTHVNMDEFHGDADALRSKIQNFYMSTVSGNPVVFSMTLNADQNTADELKKIALGDATTGSYGDNI
jgi:O-acetyl-ADP-ribose deacetylase (regulator of RNase III)